MNCGFWQQVVIWAMQKSICVLFYIEFNSLPLLLLSQLNFLDKGAELKDSEQRRGESTIND